MSSKTINLNFFRLTPQTTHDEIYKELVNAIKNVFNRFPANFHLVIRSDSRVNLYGTIEQKDDVFFGYLINNQTSDIPLSLDE